MNLLAVMSSSAEAQRELLEADIVPMLGYLFTKVIPNKEIKIDSILVPKKGNTSVKGILNKETLRKSLF